MPAPRRSFGRRPIVLARLPHASAAEYGPSVSAERSVEECEKRVLSSSEEAPTRTYFIDGQHLADESGPRPKREVLSKQSRSHLHKSYRSKTHDDGKQETRSDTSFGQPTRSTPVGEALCQFHALVAPFAGAIVALALVASAGLLYWLIVSPGRFPTEFGDPAQIGFEAIAGEESDFVPEFSRFDPATSSTSNDDAAVGNTPWWEVEQGVATPGPPTLEEEVSLSIEEPMPVPSTVGSIAEQTSQVDTNEVVNSAGPTGFPTTNRPTALDFAKLSPAVQSDTADTASQSTPQADVANLTEPAGAVDSSKR